MKTISVALALFSLGAVPTSFASSQHGHHRHSLPKVAASTKKSSAVAGKKLSLEDEAWNTSTVSTAARKNSDPNDPLEPTVDLHDPDPFPSKISTVSEDPPSSAASKKAKSGKKKRPSSSRNDRGKLLEGQKNQQAALAKQVQAERREEANYLRGVGDLAQAEANNAAAISRAEHPHHLHSAEKKTAPQKETPNSN